MINAITKITNNLGLKRFQLKRLDRFETLNYLIDNNLSISRFGDGECSIAFDHKGIHFQEYSDDLKDKLLKVLTTKNDKILVSFNNSFVDESKYRVIVKYGRTGKVYDSFETIKLANDIGILERKNEQIFYKGKFREIRRIFKNPILGDATVFYIGFYYKEYQKANLEIVFELYKRLFKDKRILFVCPENPLMSKSFRTLIEEGVIQSHEDATFYFVPSTNAFSKYKEILESILERQDTFDLVIIQAGPTATVLAHELSTKHNIKAYDVGSLNESIYKVWMDTNFIF